MGVDIFNKGLVSKIQRHHIPQYQKHNLIEEWAQDLSSHFSKEIANRYMRRYPKSLIFRKIANLCQNEVSPHIYQFGYHQKKKKNKCGEEAEERKPQCTATGLEIAAATMENIIEIPLKILKI